MDTDRSGNRSSSFNQSNNANQSNNVNKSNNAGNFCVVEECRELSAAELDNQPLCLEHFFSRCYQALECYDGRRDHTRGVHEAERAQVRGFLEECSAQALNVGLRNENLNNLQRSRLLDVLLWAGELSECVRASHIGLRGSMEQRSSRGRGSRELPSDS